MSDATDNVLLPLEWNGSTLSIPNASRTRDGYLSTDAFILFSGGTVVPVTSFNTRTGEVVLLDDDVLAALGYVPLNKHGDTMTGPLLLPAGPPPSALAAAHKQYVDAATGGGTGTYYLSNFNTSGSALRFTGTIAPGALTTLTLSVASDFAVGQGILIKGAGSNAGIAGALLTKVDAIDATGRIITLHDPAAGAVSAVANNVQHDDGVAIQTAIDTAFAAGGGTILVGLGFYRINGRLTDINSLIKMPFTQNYPPAGASEGKAIGLIALNQAFPTYWGDLQRAGAAIFQTDVIGANSNSSMIAAATWVADPINGAQSASALTVYISGITFRTYDNPQISAVDMGMAGNAILNYISIDTGIQTQNVSQPTHGTFGLRTTCAGGGMAANAYNYVYSHGYGIGIILTEQFRSTWFLVEKCAIGMQCNFGSQTLSGTGLITECTRPIEINDRQPLDLHIVFQLTNVSAWYATATGNDIYDPGNHAAGIIRYTKSVIGDFTPKLLSVTGGNKLTLMNLENLGTIFPGNVTIGGQLTVFDGSQRQPVSFGVDNSAGSGFRNVKIPNVGTE